MRIAILDYGSGNLRSAAKAFERAARDAGLEATIVVTDRAMEVAAADRVVLPGVGAFADCKRGLDAVPDLSGALHEVVFARARPFLGICVGMQLMASIGREHEEVAGLGWLPGAVLRLAPSDPALKIPHMGWNTLRMCRPHPLLAGVKTGDDGWHAYFVHSYRLAADDPEHVIAETDHGGSIAALVSRDNIAGTQFHPEKSQRLGLALISNFLRWRP